MDSFFNFLVPPSSCFLLSVCPPTHLQPQIAGADVMTADLRNDHSSLREANLLAKVRLTFLLASNPHFILYALCAVNHLLVLEWFRPLRIQTTR